MIHLICMMNKMLRKRIKKNHSNHMNQKNHSSDNIPQLRFPEFKGEWERKKLGDIAKFSKGKGISKSEIAEDGKTECIRYGELYTRYNEVISEVYSKTNVDVKNLVLSEGNDVIIPASGETQIDIATASCVIKKGIALGGDLNIIKTENNGVFLSYYLNNEKKNEIANLAQGISVVHLYSSQLATLSLNLPTLPEQKRIASFFTVLDKKISELKQKKTLLEQYKKGVMQLIFNYDSFDLDDDDEKANEKSQQSQKSNKSPFRQLRFKDDKGKDFPKWEKKKLGDVARITTGSSNRQDSNLDGNYTFFDRSQDIRTSDRFLFDAEAVIVPGEGQEFIPKYFVGKFDLHQRTYAIMDFKNQNGKFLFYSITHNSNHLNSHAVGSTVKSLRLPMFEKMPIDLPCLAEQTKIANFLSSLDGKINRTQNQIQQTEQYKKGLLQKMFV